MPAYEGDRVKKEREALDLIIRMKRGNQSSHRAGEIIFFVIIPIVLAVCIIRFRDIKDFAAHNKQVSSVIKTVYPAWKEAEELPAVPTQGEEAAAPGAEPAVPGAEPVPAGPEAGATPEGSPLEGGSTAPSATQTPTQSPDASGASSYPQQPPTQRGKLLNQP